MNEDFTEIARRACGANEIFHLEDIQSLWSGYGMIARYGLRGGEHETVVIKHVKLPGKKSHPRGWNSDRSHKRKVRSYHVESSWYRKWSRQCDDRCRVPHCYALKEGQDEFLMVFEDLDASGFPRRFNSVSLGEMSVCLRWLANFHATFMGQKASELWKVGTYWHLDTRPDELAALKDDALKAAAGAIDRQLREARFQTLVHGDAKLANFCFSYDGHEVAAVDFQYVGGGCGMKDVAYFVGSCLDDRDCERHERQLLDIYFAELREALGARGSSVDINALEAEWRPLYAVAWTDFHRFVKGWSPGHWKIHGYSERLARDVIASLGQSA